MLSPHDQLLLQHLSQFPSEHKKEFIENVLDQRTRYVTVVLENIYQSQNASAVIRTCECMGLQDIHVIENTSRYEINRRVLKGSEKWITLNRYRTPDANNTEVAIDELRNKGYTLYAADPSIEGISVDEIQIDQKPIAIIFGNELHGISDYAKKNCDELVRVPMYGFTESLNISVSVALSLQSILSRLRKSDVNFFLSDSEKEDLRLLWYKKIVHRSDVIEREFMRTIA
jgi:tRNA (guanosine-2'-O-)-methyltransferase